ncbi:hypothetical protein NO1_0710 [Candidatus Termititenax aidoneus]|uniref:Phage tail fiber protein n=1 Tax=Termititenax aidoneus TaxID=2218524 RepID=A0A388TAW5_TERA1|nr:hypothetical protein NO1_0710 [Candidatus Termititenax aidoneus]
MTIARGEPMLANDILDLTFFPVGSILMMDGSWTDGRGDWYICDGRDTPYGKTPNLIDQFIRGAASSGMTGGSNVAQSITLTAENLPSHKHSIADKTHTHIQDPHNHTQNSHNHTQSPHNHTQDGHSHTQNEHNHVQNPHNHTQNAHGHTDSGHSHTFQNSVDETDGYDVTLQGNPNHICRTTSVSTGYASIQGTTATNVETTAVNNAVAATNQPTTATNQPTTATNEAVTATNIEAAAVNQAAGTGITETETAGSGSPITLNAVLPPYYTLVYIKKMA